MDLTEVSWDSFQPLLTRDCNLFALPQHVYIVLMYFHVQLRFLPSMMHRGVYANKVLMTSHTYFKVFIMMIVLFLNIPFFIPLTLFTLG